MTQAHLKGEFFGQFFDLVRSIRYHEHRRAFFELMHRITNVLTIFLAGNILFVLSIKTVGEQAWWMSGIAFAGAFMAATDLVVGFGRMANLHTELKNAYTAMEVEAVESDGGDEALKKLRRERELIERREPPIYRALDAVCYNEAVCSLMDGTRQVEALKKIPRLSMLTRHLYRWPHIGTLINKPSRPG